MAFPLLYRDIGKSSNDLTNKGYISTDRYQWKIEVDTVSDSGVQFLPSLSQASNGALDGELKSKFKAYNFSFTTSGNLRQEISIEAASDKPIQGLVKPTFTVSTSVENPVERAKLKTQTELRGNYGNLTASLELPVARFLREVSFKPEIPKANISAVVGSRDYGVSLGAEVEVLPDTGSVRALSTVLSFARPNLEVTAFSKRRDASVTLGANFYQKLAVTSRLQDAAVGAELTHEVSANNKPPTLTIAGTHKPDQTSIVKGRVSSRGVLGLAYTQRFNGPFTVTVGADLDVLKAHEVGSLQWGVKLSVK